jgi:maltose alpha-D-glucosyltransferase/alpha-amylase
MVFPGVQTSTWTFERRVREYYFHRFYSFEPDLNMDNPAVRDEVRRILGFWLQLGVAGFRMDAVPFVIEKPSPNGTRKPQCFEYLHEMREFLQWRAGDAVLLGEANVEPKQVAPYFAEGHGLHLMFNFWVNQHLFYALASGDARPLVAAIRATKNLPPTAHWAQFLRNHDELDLGRLSDEQRALVFSRFAPDPNMQLFERGIRRRLAPMLAQRPMVELAYSVLFSLPGAPVLRYGDEIGMGDKLTLPERYPVRTPMQWSSEPNGGFSPAARLVRPLVSDGVYGYEALNVEQQRRDVTSLLHWMIRIVRLRKECPEIGWGKWELVPTRLSSVLAMAYRWRGSTLVCVHNFDDQPQQIKLAIRHSEREALVDLVHDESINPDARARYQISLEPYGYRWFRLHSPQRPSKSD